MGEDDRLGGSDSEYVVAGLEATCDLLGVDGVAHLGRGEKLELALALVEDVHFDDRDGDGHHLSPEDVCHTDDARHALGLCAARRDR